MMGSPPDEEGHRPEEGPCHEVSFASGFWMFETACRKELWNAVMGEKHFDVVTGKNSDNRREPMLPITNVSWEDARRFATRLNAAMPGLGIDLPSEAQWEYACRANTNTAYNFGQEISRNLVNFGSKGTLPVGSLPPNGWGLHEMHGNVWEWCADTWHDNYDGAPSDGSAWIGTDGGTTRRVIRGGSWYDFARSVRAAYRYRSDPANRLDYLGFRCIRLQTNTGTRALEPPAGRRNLSERREIAITTTLARHSSRRMRD